MSSVAALFDVDEFVGWVSEDGNGATGILIRIDERRAIDPIAALPFDGKRGRGFHDLDRFGFAISGEPCGEEISAVEQPRIAGFGRENAERLWRAQRVSGQLSTLSGFPISTASPSPRIACLPHFHLEFRQ